MSQVLPDHMPTPTCCVTEHDGMIYIHEIPVAVTDITLGELHTGANLAENRAQVIRDRLVTGEGLVHRATAQHANFDHTWWAAAFRCAANHVTARNRKDH